MVSSDRNRSVDPRVRLAIAQWPDDAPRGAVTTFCAEHSISRKTFYVLRRRARLEGPAAVLEPRSRRPRTSPARLPEAVRSQALEVRAALERSGLDHGPISVHDKMASMGLKAPSPAWLARLFRDQGVARSEPSKRPRAAWRRFVYPAPNACWQLDATEYVITQGRKVVIFQLQDDHSRLAVASLVASSETSQAAIDVFDKGVAARGVPQRLRGRQRHGPGPQPKGVYRTPGGARALPRGRAHHLQAEPYHPTTQGTNEHFGQPLFRYLERQPLAASIAELQRKPRPSAARHRQDRKKASESTEIAKLRAEARGLHQENEFPKSSRFLRQGTTVTKRYNLNSREESHYPVTSMCRWSRVSKSGHYSWLDRPQSQTGHREEGSGHHD